MDFTFKNTNRFLPGTSVALYPTSNWPGSRVDTSAAPVGSATDTQVMGTNNLTFTGLIPGQDYVAYALVNGVHTYVSFASPPAQVASSGTVLVVGTDPAANNEVSQTVLTGKSWRLLAVSVALVQGATQTPQPILVLDNGTTTFYESFGSSAAQAVSTTCRYTWAPELPLTGQIGATVNVHSTAPLPNGIVLGPGYRIKTSTLGIGANSDYGAPSLLVAELS